MRSTSPTSRSLAFRSKAWGAVDVRPDYSDGEGAHSLLQRVDSSRGATVGLQEKPWSDLSSVQKFTKDLMAIAFEEM